jgi:hypothetical protein
MIPDRPRRVPAPEVPQGTREQLGAWMSQKFAEIEAAHQARIELIRNGGEHPMPVFQQMARQFGALGMPKTLTAKMMGMSTANLATYYGEDYDLGAAEVISMVAANMIRIGTSTTDPNASKVGMAILDRRGGDEWVPPAQKIVTSDDRKQPPLIDSSKLSFQDRRALEEILMRAANGDAEPTDDEPVSG